MHLMFIAGARPQFIKLAALCSYFSEFPGIRKTIVHTGQHHDTEMSAVFFEELGIPKPSYYLEAARSSSSAMVATMLDSLSSLLKEDTPDGIVVFGDTHSTLAGALAAAQFTIKLAHIEAGMRSGESNLPEEVNRKIADLLSDLLFCSSEEYRRNILSEFPLKSAGSVFNTGDLSADAARIFKERRPPLPQWVPKSGFILCTIHRAYNVDNREALGEIVAALNVLNQEKPVCLLAHPRTRKALHEFAIQPKFQVEPPQSFLSMQALLNACSFVVTDSGGLQKEAAMAGKFCITLRGETEWKELVQAGVNRTASPSNLSDMYREMSSKSFPTLQLPYGDGFAGRAILEIIQSQWN